MRISELRTCEKGRCGRGIASLIFLILIAANVDLVGRPVLFTNHEEMNLALMNRGYSNAFEIVLSTNSLMMLGQEFLTNLFNEIQGADFKALVTEIKPVSGLNHQVPEFRALFCIDQSWFWVGFGVFLENDDQAAFQRFEKRARFYVESRCEGHSLAYVKAAISETKSTNYVLPFMMPKALKRELWVPHEWLRKAEKEGMWLVIDGQFAWLYNQFGFCQRRDSIEYRPELAKVFEAARQAAAIVPDEQKHLKQRVDPEYNKRLQHILKQKYGVDWTTPEELEMMQ